MLIETDVRLPDGRTLHAYDSGAGDRAVVWHHGSPQVGAPLEPLLRAATARGIRLLSYDRPGYGGSTRHPNRDVASAAGDVVALADALGIDRFAVVGHSGGGPHALACGAVLPDRVTAVVSVAGLAPFDADGLDWFAGMGTGGAEELRAAVAGRDTLSTYLTSADFDTELFTPADRAALAGAWSSLGANAELGTANGIAGLVDDDLAFVAPWGCAPARVLAPILVLHGGRDRIVPRAHGDWLARHCPTAELRLRQDDGHLSVLDGCAAALDWLGDHVPAD